MVSGCALVAAVAFFSFGYGDLGLGLRRESRLASGTRTSLMVPPVAAASAPTKPEVGRTSPPVPPLDVSTVLRELTARDERTIADLAALLDSTADASLRGSAAQLLAEMGTPAAVAVLLNAIVAASPDERRDTLVAALDSLTNPEAAPALSAFLLRTNEPALVTPVRDALARLADGPGVLEIVTAWHESAAERWQQANLEGALLSVRSPAAVPILREILLREDAPALRGDAALALGYIGGPESTAALTTALAGSRPGAVSEAVKESLGLLQRRALKGANQSDEPP